MQIEPTRKQLAPNLNRAPSVATLSPLSLSA